MILVWNKIVTDAVIILTAWQKLDVWKVSEWHKRNVNNISWASPSRAHKLKTKKIKGKN